MPKRFAEVSFMAALPVLLLAVFANGQDASECSRPDTTISGNVRAGDPFESAFGRGLVFRLQPETHPQNPQGWTIQVTDSVGANDFVVVATPPYRFSNPRYLDTSYGKTAAAAVEWTPRSFQFVLSGQDFVLMYEAIGTLLWPADKSEEEVVAARGVMSAIQTASGTFRILSSDTSPPTDALPLGRIEYLGFEVDLCGADN